MASELIRASEVLFDEHMDDDADLQRALELSLKDSRGSAAFVAISRPVVAIPANLPASRVRALFIPLLFIQGSLRSKEPPRSEDPPMQS